MGGHSSRRRIAPPLQQPTRTASAAAGRRPYSVLLPVGFAVPAAVAGAAVRSYRTLSPSRFRRKRDLLSVALSLGQKSDSWPAGRYPAPLLRGARTFLPPSPRLRRASPLKPQRRPAAARSSGRP